MYSKIRSQSAYPVEDWKAPSRSFERRASYDQPDIGASLIATLLLSLGLWATIWAILASVTSVALG